VCSSDLLDSECAPGMPKSWINALAVIDQS